MADKIRNAQLQKLPFLLVVGAREAAGSQTVVRIHDGRNGRSVHVDAFVKRLSSEIRARQ
ncbi:MAG: hypothetical protein HY360_03630 [Verrucomicrobia bacterium]|nr:hypothetical protein [Verrucomicrobiota bacterium]